MAEPSRGIQGAPAPDPLRTRNALKQARLHAIAQGQAHPRVRVLPASDDMRRILKHPRGMKFRSTGSVEWPLDKFTQRRLREGSITIEERPEVRPQPHHQQHPQHHHQQPAHRSDAE
jgi:hypothetical protein